MQVAGCFPYGGDGAADQRAHRRQVAERREGLRDYTAETERGTDLSGQALVDALSGRTLVYHYGSFLDGRRGDYVTYHHYRPDGRLVYVDNWLDSSGQGRKGHYWKVTGPRLCVVRQSYSSTPLCYRVARTDAGAIQFYTDDPTEPYHGFADHLDPRDHRRTAATGAFGTEVATGAALPRPVRQVRLEIIRPLLGGSAHKRLGAVSFRHRSRSSDCGRTCN